MNRGSELLAVLELPNRAAELVAAYADQAKATYVADLGEESWPWGDSVVIEKDLMCQGPCGVYMTKAVIGPDDAGYMLIRLMLRPG